VTGKKDDKKKMKIRTARDFWVPSVNNFGKYGKWAILEVQDIYETQNLIRAGIERGFDNLLPGGLLNQ
jgi:type III restriction enzyme